MSTDELFEHELQDVYFAEHELTTAYKRMTEQTADDDIQAFLENHVDETGTHIERLVEVFEETGEPPQTEECEGIEGLLSEWGEFAEDTTTGPILDYYNLITAIKTERYEQSAYESLVDLAERQDRTEAADLLRSNLDEDEETLDELNQMATDYDALP